MVEIGIRERLDARQDTSWRKVSIRLKKSVGGIMRCLGFYNIIRRSFSLFFLLSQILVLIDLKKSVSATFKKKILTGECKLKIGFECYIMKL